MIPALIHFLQPSLDESGVFEAGPSATAIIHLFEDLPTGGRQRQKVFPFRIDFELQILQEAMLP